MNVEPSSSDCGRKKSAIARSDGILRHYHLHEYIVDGRRYGTPDPAYDGTGEIIRETGVRLATVLPQPGAEILYVYDFGDYWQHDLRLEAVFVAEPGIKYPRVPDGARSCPPEDC